MTATLVDFTREGVQPPSRFYLRPFERFEIRSWCSIAGVTLGLHGLILTPVGTVQEISEVHSPNADRSIALSRFILPEGFLLHLQVRDETEILQHGECFVTINIIRGLAGGSTRVSTLLADYVTTMVAPTYPVSQILQSVNSNGAIKSITGTNPIAGAEILETVPVNARWRILAVRFTLIADANVANRIVHLHFDDSANTFSDVCITTAHVANTTKIYNFANFGGTQIAPANCLYIPLPPFPLLEGYRIRTVTDNIQVGDDFSAPQLLIEEWLTE